MVDLTDFLNANNCQPIVVETPKASEPESEEDYSKPFWHHSDSSFNEEERELLDEHYENFVGSQSALLGKVLEKASDVIAHVQMMEVAKAQMAQAQKEAEEGPKRGRPRKNPEVSEKATSERRTAWNQYLDACRQHKQEVKDAWSSYVEARDNRDKVLAELNAEVESLKLRHKELKDRPTPQPPKK